VARKKRDSDDGGGGEGANWMDTYGDLVTLLLCFFVLLFSFSSIDSAKWQALVDALSAGGATTNGIIAIDPLSPAQAVASPIDNFNIFVDEDVEQKALADANLSNLVYSVQDFVSTHDLEVDMKVDYDSYTVTMHFADNVFFRTGEADLMPDSLPILNNLIDLLTGIDKMYMRVDIEGHTDNVPIHTAKYPSNWELSTARAVNSLHYIADTGLVDISRLSVAGYGEYHPLDVNTTAEGRAKNRRVDFVIRAHTEF
jgi:chemotaxis protein MotB